ncbi:MAG TPA: hypothetical protein VLJ42_04835 [Solirubrobacteraceae bacterium]|nr:hypothetical protein [Solirubrobacteraceae bacterium]
MSDSDWVLLGVALLAGITGTWSPCGLSTIETLRVGGVHGRGRLTAVGTSLAFALGALAGALTTFGVLALLGALVRSPHSATGPAIALVIAAGAAVLEATGTRIVPQVRRQVPEPWRRQLPVTLAATIYGALLGLGFTTFVMTFAVWALAGITVALGEPHVGLLVGIGFGIGRAVPVIVLAPLADLRVGERVLSSMIERPAILRGLRLADAAALAACVLALAGPARAASVYRGKTDPSAAPGELAWQQLGAGGFVSIGGRVQSLPGENPALGGGLIAWRSGSAITIADGLSLAPKLTVSAPGADQLALSSHWLVYRAPPARDSRYRIFAVRLQPLGSPTEVASARAPTVLGRPALDGDTLVFHAAGRESRIVAINLANGRKSVLRSAVIGQLLNPSIAAGRLLYVRVDDCRQQLLVGPLSAAGHHDRVLAARSTQVPRDGGYQPGAIREGRTPHHCIGPRAGSYHSVFSYWTTALSGSNAFLTVLKTSRGKSSGRLVTVSLH